MTEKEIIERVMGVEGGFSDHPADTGGKTKYGVTEYLCGLYSFLWVEYNFHGDMRTLPYALAYEILRREFWVKMRLSEVCSVAPLVADKMFDWGVNMGPTEPVEALQRHLNAANRNERHGDDIDADGIIGSRTLRALGEYMAIRPIKGERVLVFAMTSMQAVAYENICKADPEQEEFYFGWLDRAFEALPR